MFLYEDFIFIQTFKKTINYVIDKEKISQLLSEILTETKKILNKVEEFSTEFRKISFITEQKESLNKIIENIEQMQASLNQPKGDKILKFDESISVNGVEIDLIRLESYSYSYSSSPYYSSLLYYFFLLF